MEESSDKKKLKVVEEEPSEDVLRLGDKGSKPQTVGRMPLPPTPEVPARLEQSGSLEDVERRSIEPDIDSIIDGGAGAEEDFEWMSEKTAHPTHYGWFVLVFLLIGGLALTSAILILRSPESEAEVSKQAAVERMEEDETADAEALALVETVEESLRRFMASESIEELLPTVRDPERVEPLMRDWYARHPMPSREFVRLGVFQPLDLEGRTFWLVTCEVTGGQSETLLVEQKTDGRVLVDWETQVCYQPMSWDEYVKNRPEGDAVDFRLYLQPDRGGFFSHEFRSEEDWSVYRLTAKDAEDYLFGYAPKGSELEERLNALASRNRGLPVALLLRIRIPEGTTSPRGVVIEEVLSERWALIRPVADE
ncbi:hypothetical protein [Haloferula sp.]|uniref:hypothetical protein n=1 Tax=Haloferula sp. TaxID=2497595 RepID=UPI003C718935